MRVQELLPLQAFLEWLKKTLPYILGLLFVPGRPENPYFVERYTYRVEQRTFWRSVVRLMVDVSDDLSEGDDEADTDVEALRKANRRLEADLRKMEKRVERLTKLLDDQTTIIGALAASK